MSSCSRVPLSRSLGHGLARLAACLLASATLAAAASSCSPGGGRSKDPTGPPTSKQAAAVGPADLQQAEQYVALAEKLGREAKYASALASVAKASEIYKAGRSWESYVHCLNGMGE
jgi:hypothetical protein